MSDVFWKKTGKFHPSVEVLGTKYSVLYVIVLLLLLLCYVHITFCLDQKKLHFIKL